MSKELGEDFLYFDPTRDLWKDLEQRFRESNGPLLYQIKRNLSLLTQEDANVMQYYTKIKRL